jgi:Na+-driven multidrug efflux pump
MVVGTIIFQTIPEFLLRNLFEASDHMVEIGVPALRIISLCFIIAGFCIIFGSVFQAMGNGVYSLIVSVCRQLLTILPLAYIFAKVFGLHMVWWAYPIAEIASVTACTYFLRKIIKQKVEVL